MQRASHRIALFALVFLASNAGSAEESPQVIKEGSKVSVEYTLTLDDGSTVDSNVGGKPLVFQYGGGQLLPGVEKELAGMKASEAKEFTLEPEDGYGEIRSELRQEVDATLIPEDARKPGARLTSSDSQGNQRPFRVHEIKGDKIVIDFNHPLAGQKLHFSVKVLGIE